MILLFIKKIDKTFYKRYLENNTIFDGNIYFLETLRCWNMKMWF